MNGYCHFSEAALLRLLEYVGPMERLKLQQCCKRFYRIYSKWFDITSLDIRITEQKIDDSEETARRRRFVQRSKNTKFAYRIRLENKHGTLYNLKSNSDRYANRTLKTMLSKLQSLSVLTIWDACLSEDFSTVLSQLQSITTLRIWNSVRYFDKKRPAKRLLHALFSFPLLESIFVLDSTFMQSTSQCTSIFPYFLVDSIQGSIVNLQIAGIYISSKTFEALCEKLRKTVKRLAIGCTYGKESKRKQYCKAIAKLEVLEDLDIPPHIFHLGEVIEIDDEALSCLFNNSRLHGLGFRHYNSTVLFRFIEFKMPHNICLLRIHHSANRIPNFAQLGMLQPKPEEKPVPQRKSSWLTARNNSMGSKNSIVSSSDRSIESSSNELWKKSPRSSIAVSESSHITQIAVESCANSRKTNLSTRNLTILAIEEAPRTMIECAMKLRRRVYSGVEIFYMQESVDTQEILGRMAAPMRSPYVYTRSSKREMRVIKGDLVRPIPLSSLGMESDYEMSDWED
ncbi:unnamed protein product [Thelazia callipaeda]|uniref:F-box domain-containing protein n=1 Tax=Thelazia callipaeda TaxID=103827 RepID=A0A158RAQ7_THECL|nr:unnamed protein product [Thelazia callipaeda]